MPNRLLPRRLAIDRVQREGDFDEFLAVGHVTITQTASMLHPPILSPAAGKPSPSDSRDGTSGAFRRLLRRRVRRRTHEVCHEVCHATRNCFAHRVKDNRRAELQLDDKEADAGVVHIPTRKRERVTRAKPPQVGCLDRFGGVIAALDAIAKFPNEPAYQFCRMQAPPGRESIGHCRERQPVAGPKVPQVENRYLAREHTPPEMHRKIAVPTPDIERGGGVHAVCGNCACHWQTRCGISHASAVAPATRAAWTDAHADGLLRRLAVDRDQRQGDVDELFADITRMSP